MEFLNDNIEWLLEKMANYQDHYFIIDFPGQLELFLNSGSVRNIIQKLRDPQNLRMRVTAVELFDSHYVQDPTKYLSACCYSLMTMINLDLPQINVLSKIDLIDKVGKLDFKMEYYLECTEFETLADKLNQNKESKFVQKYSKLTKNLCNMLENYGKNFTKIPSKNQL